ncbi:MAG: class I SAM-dependent methyltransferase, partial [Nocardioidaceae bacterium]
MTTQDPEAFSRRLAAESLTEDDPTGWFDRLYAAADQGETSVPWDRGVPHPLLVEWAQANGVAGPGRALVVGCGLGFDSEY